MSSYLPYCHSMKHLPTTTETQTPASLPRATTSYLISAAVVTFTFCNLVALHLYHAVRANTAACSDLSLPTHTTLFHCNRQAFSISQRKAFPPLFADSIHARLSTMWATCTTDSHCQDAGVGWTNGYTPCIITSYTGVAWPWVGSWNCLDHLLVEQPRSWSQF